MSTFYTGAKAAGESLKLPQLPASARYPVEQLLAHRRSVREFADRVLSLEELGRLLWAAQGVTDAAGLRTAPSAGALYPLELVIAAGRVEGLQPGIYRYQPRTHGLRGMAQGDARARLAGPALGQSWLADAAATLVFAAVLERTARKYGRRAFQYICIEVGHAAQNVYLEAQSLGLGTVMVGAFDDGQVQRVLGLAEEETPLALMPLGRR